MKVERQIRKIVEDILAAPIERGSDPLSDNLLDSLDVEELLMRIEEKYGVEFTDEDLVPENFASVATLAGFVDTKRR